MTAATTPVPPRAADGLRFVACADPNGPRALAPPDIATCDACLRELFDRASRRYRHPFISCAACGPRFTLIKRLPYDRPATTMAGFPMCEPCRREYHDPADRRFRAQSIACHDCGPTLRFTHDGDAVTGSDKAIAAAQRVLAAGGIVAVKGIGGYHLACRADCPETVSRLRERKARGDKPFAVLTRNLSTARLLAEIDTGERRSLTSAARPIVLLRRLPSAPLAEPVAPGSPLFGVLLPYAPVHHLLLAPVPDSTEPVPHTLVLTSANSSDEPPVFDDEEADVRLSFLADAVLGHDRPIHVPCDDSVVRSLGDEELPIRRARGYPPLPVPSQADESALLVQHHHAHVASLLAEHGRLGDPVIGFAFDGPGYGTDGEIRGGEILRVGPDPATSDRIGHLLPVPLAGGDAAACHPYRMALSYLAAAGVAWDPALPSVAACTDAECAALAALHAENPDPGGQPGDAGLLTGTQLVPCSSMGRLFDAVASLLGVRHRISYEAQAAIELEILAAQASDAAAGLVELTLPVGADLIIDHRPLIRALASQVLSGTTTAVLARAFHVVVAEAVAASAARAAREQGIRTVGLTGDVFQNVLLTSLCRTRLESLAFEVLTHRLVPPNDSGLALGQTALAALAASAEQRIYRS